MEERVDWAGRVRQPADILEQALLELNGMVDRVGQAALGGSGRLKEMIRDAIGMLGLMVDAAYKAGFEDGKRVRP